MAHVNNSTDWSLLRSTLEPDVHGLCHPNWDNPHEKVKRIILIPLSIFILGTNGVVLLFSALDRKLHRPTYWFMTSLGIADMCVGFASIGVMTTKANEGTLSLCLVRIGFTISAIQASTLFLMGIAVDRYIAIIRSLTYTQTVTSFRVKVAVIWLVVQSLLIGFAPLMGWNNPDYQFYCSFLYVLSPGYVIFLFIVALLPIILVFGIYIKLYCSARGHIKKIEALENLGVCHHGSRPFGMSSRSWKSVKTTLCVIGCLLITWCPFLTATAVQLVLGVRACFLKEIVGTYMLLLGFTNSFLNPLIYAVSTKQFKDTIRDTFKRRCCAKN